MTRTFARSVVLQRSTASAMPCGWSLWLQDRHDTTTQDVYIPSAGRGGLGSSIQAATRDEDEDEDEDEDDVERSLFGFGN